MLQASDSTIRSYLRSVLTHRRIELSCLDIGSFRGTVRLRGELRRIGGSTDLTAEALEVMERDIQHVRGVRRVFLHFANWRKVDETGEWVPVDHSGRQDLSLQELDGDDDPEAA